MSFAEPNKTYKFRVCQYISTSAAAGGGVCGAWSVVKTASTALSPHGIIILFMYSISYIVKIEKTKNNVINKEIFEGEGGGESVFTKDLYY